MNTEEGKENKIETDKEANQKRLLTIENNPSIAGGEASGGLQ